MTTPAALAAGSPPRSRCRWKSDEHSGSVVAPLSAMKSCEPMERVTGIEPA
jgi:hypothetical protein